MSGSNTVTVPGADGTTYTWSFASNQALAQAETSLGTQFIGAIGAAHGQ